MKTLRLFAAAASMMAAAGAAYAQDFTGVDISQMYGQWAAGQNYQMQSGLNDIISQNMQNPQVIAMYNQSVASGQFSGSLEQFAYNYAATAGFTNVQGYYNTSNDIVNKEKQAWAGYQGAVNGYRNAYGAYTDGFSENMQEAGRGLMGQSTYYGYGNGQQLPHTWQPETYQYYQGNEYFVDQSGTYWMADPNGSGYWYELRR